MGEERDQLRKRPARRTDLNAVYLVGNRTLEADVPATGTDRDARDTGWDLPALGNDVPHGEVETRELQRDGGRLSGAEEDAVEAFEVERRGLCRGGGRGIQLRDLVYLVSAYTHENDDI